MEEDGGGGGVLFHEIHTVQSEPLPCQTTPICFRPNAVYVSWGRGGGRGGWGGGSGWDKGGYIRLELFFHLKSIPVHDVLWQLTKRCNPRVIFCTLV